MDEAIFYCIENGILADFLKKHRFKARGNVLFEYDENWHMYVDGEEVEILPLWNKSLVAAKVPAGEHEIRLEYRQKGLVPGIVLSVLVILLLILYYNRLQKEGVN